jgi:acyl-CoA synthetase (NDP forming)
VNVISNKAVSVAMEEIGKKKIDSPIIMSAGFKETGEQGARLKKKFNSSAKNMVLES